MAEEKITKVKIDSGAIKSRMSFTFLTWLGGAVFVAHQPGMGFWDGLVWMYYVGRYIAAHFAMLST